MPQTLKEKLSKKEKWIRLIFIVIFWIIGWITRPIIGLITIFQFIYTLFVGKPLKTLLPFSESLCMYIREIAAFLTYVTEEKPFPFKPWPPSTIKATKPAAKRIKKPEPKAAEKPAAEK